MKIAPLLCGTALAALSMSPAWSLNFTPRVETQTIDGYAIHYLSFEDGDQRVAYGPPANWRTIGSGDRLVLEDPENRQAQASLTVLPVAKAEPFTPAILKNLKLAALALAPKDASDLTINEASGQSPVGNREAYSATVSYGYYGQKYRLRVMFLNLGKSHLQICCSAPEAKFEAFANALDSSLYSWHWVAAK